MVLHGVAQGTFGGLFRGPMRDSIERDMIWLSYKTSVAYVPNVAPYKILQRLVILLPFFRILSMLDNYWHIELPTSNEDNHMRMRVMYYQ